MKPIAVTVHVVLIPFVVCSCGVHCYKRNTYIYIIIYNIAGTQPTRHATLRDT